MSQQYLIRTMTRDELQDIAIAWAHNEGWNPGLYDIDSFYSTDPTGFYVGLLKDQPISCISTVAYNQEFGFLGFYIVKTEYRNKGYGYELWKEALKHLPSQNIGLDGVLDQQENYKKSGFKLAHRNIRFKGFSKKYNNSIPQIKEVDSDKLDKILEYDKDLFPTQREMFLKHWFKQPESYSFVFSDNNIVKGYGMIRRCHSGYKIGPLFADNKEIATELFRTLCNSLEENTEFYLDTPEINTDAINLSESNSMTYTFETARMYTKEIPSINLNKIFGITTFELG